MRLCITSLPQIHGSSKISPCQGLSQELRCFQPRRLQASGDDSAAAIIPCTGKARTETQGWMPTGRCQCFMPSQGLAPPALVKELPDFRQEAGGMMTKLPYCKKRPKFKMLWPNVAPSGISANTPRIGFL